MIIILNSGKSEKLASHMLGLKQGKNKLTSVVKVGDEEPDKSKSVKTKDSKEPKEEIDERDKKIVILNLKGLFVQILTSTIRQEALSTFIFNNVCVSKLYSFSHWAPSDREENRPDAQRQQPEAEPGARPQHGGRHEAGWYYRRPKRSEEPILAVQELHDKDDGCCLEK